MGKVETIRVKTSFQVFHRAITYTYGIIFQNKKTEKRSTLWGTTWDNQRQVVMSSTKLYPQIQRSDRSSVVEDVFLTKDIYSSEQSTQDQEMSPLTFRDEASK